MKTIHKRTNNDANGWHYHYCVRGFCLNDTGHCSKKWKEVTCKRCLTYKGKKVHVVKWKVKVKK